MIIVWDEPKRLSNLRKRNLEFADLRMSFFDEAVVSPAKAGRLMAVGRLEASIVAVVFRYLGAEGISVISMRRASRKERTLHGYK